jgi:hypothetical protein
MEKHRHQTKFEDEILKDSVVLGMDGACCYTTIANFAKLCCEVLLVFRAVDCVDEMVFDMAMIVMIAMCLRMVAIQKQVGCRLRFLAHHRLGFDLDSLWLKLLIGLVQ